MGGGSVIFQATTDQIGAKQVRVADQGGIRKVVTLAKTVGR